MVVVRGRVVVGTGGSVGMGTGMGTVVVAGGAGVSGGLVLGSSVASV
jgi:hypothetical protein